MRTRIEDVAAAAGVSMKTVSRVLNNEPNVREETRRKVEETVARLQYRPNPSARSLAGQRSYAIAMAYDSPQATQSSVSLNYLMEVQNGVLQACRAHHYNLVLAPVDFHARNYTQEILSLAAHLGIDGVLLTPPLTEDEQLLEQLHKHGIAASRISPRRREKPGVFVDEHAAVRELIAQLVALGHRRIGHIKGHPAHGACEWRLAGYRDALQAADIAFDPDLVVEGAFTFESGVRGAHSLLDLPDPPTAIFAANDDCAAGVMRAAGERGLSVPRDLSVCGFDDTPISQQLYPSLTTIRQPTRDMGRIATLELLKSIRNPEDGAMVPIRHSLKLRESIGPAPQA